MKKLFYSIALVVGVTFASNASKFKISDIQLEKVVAQSTEISSQELSSLFMKESKKFEFEHEKTRGGYLIWSFFCGGVGMHRYYMGIGESAKNYMWALYACVPVVGAVTACVDFWGAVFQPDFYKKYENNDKYIVWLD